MSAESRADADPAIAEIGRSNPQGRSGAPFYLKGMDYAILQQCIHCGLCLPTCPTYDATKLERNSPRGRIALMRNIADGNLGVTPAFGEELAFCLGCLACETACPAGVHYAGLFEAARADIERAGVLKNPWRNFVRALTLRLLFTRPPLLRLAGRILYFYQASGLERLVRTLGLTALLPKRLRELEPLTPRMHARFSDALIAGREKPRDPKHTVGMLTGCVQDLAYPDINRDTVDCLLANDCEVFTPRGQSCCGSIHAHNGELEIAREMARRNIDAFRLDEIDAIITNAAGCGSHLKHYGELLRDDPIYRERAAQWSAKLKDIHEWLAGIGAKPPNGRPKPQAVTYHEACHLCHGQKITRQPRQILNLIPGLQLVELPESTWCCGSAGVYNITQPEMSGALLRRKLACLDKTGVAVVATANPGCMAQLQAGIRASGRNIRVVHPISLLAEAYRRTFREARL